MFLIRYICTQPERFIFNEKYVYSIVIGSLFQVDKKKKKNTNVNLVTYKL